MQDGPNDSDLDTFLSNYFHSTYRADLLFMRTFRLKKHIPKQPKMSELALLLSLLFKKTADLNNMDLKRWTFSSLDP